MASSEISRPSTSAAPAAVLSRGVGHTQTCILLFLGVGFLLIFYYQSEIHTVVLGSTRAQSYSSSAAIESSSSDPLVKRAIQSIRRYADSNMPESLEAEKSGAAPSGKSYIHSTATQRKLESEPTNSINVTPKRKNWKDVKIDDAFMPIVESVHSNVVSSRFRLVIKVLALNDYASFTRCLSSLSKSEYAGDSVDIHIYIDHFEISEANRRRLLATEDTEQIAVEKPRSERTKKKKSSKSSKSPSGTIGDNRMLNGDGFGQTVSAQLPDRVTTGVDPVKLSDWAQVEERLSDARRVLNHAEYFQWKHGKKVIHYRTSTAGSQSQWLDAWWPSSDDEFALFLEDDTEVSPVYYRYVRSVIATYYYQFSHYDRLLYGISLQRPQIVPGKNGQLLQVDDRTRLFKYQMVGIWGQIFFPKPWKEFREWYDSKKSHNVKPVVDGMMTTDWYKEHGEKMFTPWFIKFAYSKGYFNLYTNFLWDRVLSVTHRDIKGKPKRYAGCDSVLIWSNGTKDLDMWHMAANWNIKRYDYCFKEVRAGRFANYSKDVGWVLDSTQQNRQILVISTVGVPEILVRNWLCYFRKLGVENYILVGEDPVLLEDLARRGHATMRFEKKLNLKENIEKEVSVVSDLLGLGYTLWFTRADTIWAGNPMSTVDTDGADVIGAENSQMNLFFVRNSENVISFWGSLKEELSKVAEDVSRRDNWERAREKFISTCQEDGQVQVRKLDQMVFTDGEQLSQPPTLENNGDSANRQVFVFSGLGSSEEWQIKSKLQKLGLLKIDDDLVCTTLTC